MQQDCCNGFLLEFACAGAWLKRLACKLVGSYALLPLHWLHAKLPAAVLVRAACRFAEYRKDDPQSFMLHSNLQYFPQFMFNLRRSQFVQVFGVAPDETASHRLVLFKMPVLDALVSSLDRRCDQQLFPPGASCSATFAGSQQSKHCYCQVAIG